MNPTPYELGAIDFNRPAKEVLLERLGAINGIRLDPLQFELGLPESTGETPVRASIEVLPLASSIWSTSFRIFYNRVPLSEQMALLNTVETAGATNLYAILDNINAAYGMHLTQADVLDAEIDYTDPTDTTGPGVVTLTARAGSVFFLGEVTLRVNVSISHGVAPYNDELTHYLVVQPIGSMDNRLMSYDAFGIINPNFKHIPMQDIAAFAVKEMFKDDEANLTLIGRFDFTYEGQRIEARVVRFNSRGDLTFYTMGDLYGVEYTGLVYKEANTQGRIYALDVDGVVGGTQHQSLYYNADGQIGQDWTPAITNRITAIAPYQDKVYVVYRDVDPRFAVLNRLMLSGLQDPDFTPVVIEPNTNRPDDTVMVYALAVNEDSVSALLSIAGPTWENDSRHRIPEGVAAPVTVYDHSGNILQGYAVHDPLMTTTRVGITNKDDRIAATSSALVYSAYGRDQLTGEVDAIVTGVRSDGVQTGLVFPSNMDDFHPFNHVQSIHADSRDEIVVAGTTYTNTAGVVGSAATVYAYDHQGNFAAKMVHVPNHALIKYKNHRFLGAAQ